MATFKERVRNREYLCGTHINLNDPCIAKIVGMLGFDYIWIDMEHSYLTYDHLLSHIQTIQACGTPVIVRCPQHDFTAAKKILEMGPDGIIFPMVKTKEEVDRLISYTLYPPYGNRGFGPLNAVNFGVDSALDYVTHNHETMCRFIQIEHIDLVKDLENVVDNPWIDGYIFGPNDLSGSIGQLMNVFVDDTQALVRESIDILNKHGKCIGLSTGDTSPEVVARWHDMGIHMISAGCDLNMLADNMRIMKNTLKQAHKNRN